MEKGIVGELHRNNSLTSTQNAITNYVQRTGNFHTKHDTTPTIPKEQRSLHDTERLGNRRYHCLQH